eukprot:CAMPEP_0203861470 /NCGR_PEP_ID=MMETSP0359-20131031/13026_1 /ASSEMBLY_ACC=CAM_ASM_000338 /TAXON_ID=268821 /ORGANISM="Scrippsiella Hangoei, Strain SHTV-5" /LENGTH=656 /DNA_ID=CAMNT_0050778705 /DNA_START=101 /DNA_END=2071 /DNA_ORIENTATION=-
MVAPSEPDSEETDEEERHTKMPPLPGHKDHKCTDTLSLAIFILGVACQIRMSGYGYRYGNLRKLSAGYNYRGELCGTNMSVGSNYLSYCVTREGEVLMDSPICVSKCPQGGANKTHSCYHNATGEMLEYPDVETTKVFDYCLPTAPGSLGQILEVEANFSSGLRPIHMATIVREVGEIERCWLPLLIAANIAVMVGYGYLLLLDKCAKWLVYACELVFLGGMLCVGAFLVFQGYKASVSGYNCGKRCDEGDTSFEVREIEAGMPDMVLGTCLMFLAFFAACVFLVANRSMDTAVGCIEATCECMFQEPTLLLEPFISLISKLIVFCICGPGLINLISTGEVTFGGNGIARTFTYTIEEQFYMVCEFLMFFWYLEICHACSQYTLAWTTQMWYFTPYVNGTKVDHQRCAVFRAYANALRFHLGSLALGALLHSATRPLRAVLGLVTKAAASSRNPFACCLSHCCTDFYRRNLHKLSKNAYMDLAITSSDYLISAERSNTILEEEVKSLAVLNGAQVVFQVALIGLLSFCGFFVTIVMAENVPIFSQSDSPYYIQDHRVIGIAASVLSGIIGVSFTLVFDTVGDTILYCFATEQRRHAQLDHKTYGAKDENRKGYFGWLVGYEEEVVEEDRRVDYAPQRLRDLISSHSCPKDNEGNTA